MTESRPELPDGQPSQRYITSLGLKVIGRCHLPVSERPLPAFHNNLAVRSINHDILFVAHRSWIELYEIDARTGAPTETMKTKIDTKPAITTDAMIRGANWELCPHGINFINLFMLDGEEMIGTAGDDGRALIYSVKEMVTRLNSVKPRYCVQVSKSAWGLDLDPHQRLLVVSDNSAHVTIFKLGRKRHHELLVVSPFLLDNIPDVKFVDTSEPETCRIAAITVAGLVVVWEFYYGEKLRRLKPELVKRNSGKPEKNKSESDNIIIRRSSGEFLEMGHSSEFTDHHNEFDMPPMDEEMEDLGASDGADSLIQEYYDLTHESDIYTSDCGVCLASDNLWQQGWTINCISARDFKRVPSLYEAVGNKWINEDILFERPQNDESEKIVTDDDLYQQMRFVSFEIETQFIQRSDNIAHTTSSGVPFYALAPLRSRSRKRREFLRKQSENAGKQSENAGKQSENAGKQSENAGKQSLNAGNTAENPLEDKFVILTSKKGLYLCRLQDLYCNAARSNVFCFDSRQGYACMQVDRLSIVKVIKELSAVIVVSQIGAVSVFRMTQYRGIFSLRQEYVFPDVENFLFYGPLLIAGVTCTPRKHSSGFISSVFISVIYKDGLTITYELFIRTNNESDNLLL